jgi:hypothetical protein
MKYLVDCYSQQFTVEAPSTQIAKCKVMMCYPKVNIYDVKPIGKQRMTKAEKRRLLATMLFCYVAIFAYIKYNSCEYFNPTLTRIEWLDDMIYAGPLLFCLLVVFVIGHGVCEYLSGDRWEKEDEAAREREYVRRLGYIDGWTDCEQKRTAQFVTWIAEDSKQIHPYCGPAT